jgi:hypothetical protein
MITFNRKQAFKPQPDPIKAAPAETMPPVQFINWQGEV